MSVWGEIITWLQSPMPKPQPYGAYHLLTTAAAILVGVLLCVWFKQGTEKQVRRILLVTVILTVLGEVYKQLIYTYSFDGSVVTADFQWYAFPFQFCSTPMYVGLLALLTRGKLHRACCDYLGSFAVFAGAAVLAYPVDIYIDWIGINIQTMICHGSMVAVGIYLLYTGYVRCRYKTLLRASAVFGVMVVIAAVMNEIAYRTGLLEIEDFNMFFISPYCEPSLPVYSLVQAVVPFPWCLFIYILGFMAAAGMVLLLAWIPRELIGKLKK